MFECIRNQQTILALRVPVCTLALTLVLSEHLWNRAWHSNITPQNNLAWLLATCPQAALRNGVKAVGLAHEWVRLSRGTEPGDLDTLAAASAEAGQFTKAVEAARKALALALVRTNKNVEAIRAPLKLYEQVRPYRERLATGVGTVQP